MGSQLRRYPIAPLEETGHRSDQSWHPPFVWRGSSTRSLVPRLDRGPCPTLWLLESDSSVWDSLGQRVFTGFGTPSFCQAESVPKSTLLSGGGNYSPSQRGRLSTGHSLRTASAWIAMSLQPVLMHIITMDSSNSEQKLRS